eukprot:scaffold7773_cov110-Isochrysis_galbana.AAC.3
MAPPVRYGAVSSRSGSCTRGQVKVEALELDRQYRGEPGQAAALERRPLGDAPLAPVGVVALQRLGLQELVQAGAGRGVGGEAGA